MNKSKLLTFAVIALFIINIVTLSFFIMKSDTSKRNKDARGKRMAPREIIIEKLHFDEEQIATYDLLIKNHRDSIAVLDKEIINIKNSLYKKLSSTDTLVASDSLFTMIGKTQAKIEQVHYNHFLDIKKLCKSNQIKDYENLTHELARLFNHKPQANQRKGAPRD